MILTHQCAFSIWIITPRRNVQRVLCASHIHSHHSRFSSVSGFLFSSIIFCLYENQCSAWCFVLSSAVNTKSKSIFVFLLHCVGAAVHPKSKFHPFPTRAVLKEFHPGAKTTEAHDGHALKRKKYRGSVSVLHRMVRSC